MITLFYACLLAHVDILICCQFPVWPVPAAVRVSLLTAWHPLYPPLLYAGYSDFYVVHLVTSSRALSMSGPHTTPEAWALALQVGCTIPESLALHGFAARV